MAHTKRPRRITSDQCNGNESLLDYHVPYEDHHHIRGSGHPPERLLYRLWPGQGLSGGKAKTIGSRTDQAKSLLDEYQHTVRSVDGMPVNAEVELAVLPGKRTLQLTLAPYTNQYIQDNPGPFAQHANWFNLKNQAQTTITYDFELGQEYALAGKSQTGLFTLWIQQNRLEAKKLQTWSLSTIPIE